MVYKETTMNGLNAAGKIALNIGCGFRKMDNFINVDKQQACAPDVLLDVETSEWPWADNSAKRVVFNHSLEHMGAHPDVFIHILKEVYRVCAPDATVHINTPHPRHDHFLMDPTHVRPITAQLFSLFDLEQNKVWIKEGAANTPLAIYAKVNYRIASVKVILSPFYTQQFVDGSVSRSRLNELLLERNNVAKELQIKLLVVKQEPGADSA